MPVFNFVDSLNNRLRCRNAAANDGRFENAHDEGEKEHHAAGHDRVNVDDARQNHEHAADAGRDGA